jgi:alkaline phosphatase
MVIYKSRKLNKEFKLILTLGHHETNSIRALEDFVIFDEAIGEAMTMTSREDTLIAVTADHSHVFTLGGYAVRGNDLLGINVAKESSLSNLGLTYTPLLYGNGPGGLLKIRDYNLTNEITSIHQS